MCNLSQTVWEKGEASGIEKGILVSIQNLVCNTGWPVEKAFSILDIRMRLPICRFNTPYQHVTPMYFYTPRALCVVWQREETDR